MDKRAGEFIGKTVLTLTGNRLGEISNLTFDKGFKKLKNMVVFDDEQEEFYIPIRSMFLHGENVVFVKVNLMPPVKNTYISPINIKAYSIEGKLLGSVIDLKFIENEYSVECLILDNNEELPIKHIISHGKDAVIFDFSENPKKIIQRQNVALTAKTQLINKENIKESSNEKTTEIEAGTISENQKEDRQAIEVKTEIPKKPDNLVVGAKLLTGRKVKKDIHLRNGNLLIKEGTIITLPIVNLALNNGKLFELTVNSLGNLPN
jgi:sporulation protein YlmC with PRC-barrel domain